MPGTKSQLMTLVFGENTTNDWVWVGMSLGAVTGDFKKMTVSLCVSLLVFHMFLIFVALFFSQELMGLMSLKRPISVPSGSAGEL